MVLHSILRECIWCSTGELIPCGEWLVVGWDPHWHNSPPSSPSWERAHPWLWVSWDSVGEVSKPWIWFSIYHPPLFSFPFCSQGGENSEFQCVASIHGARLTPNLAEELTVPCLLLPASDDPSIEPLQKVLDEKPFGGKCVFRTFTGLIVMNWFSVNLIIIHSLKQAKPAPSHLPQTYMIPHFLTHSLNLSPFLDTRSKSWILCCKRRLGQWWELPSRCHGGSDYDLRLHECQSLENDGSWGVGWKGWYGTINSTFLPSPPPSPIHSFTGSSHVRVIIPTLGLCGSPPNLFNLSVNFVSILVQK